MFSVTALTLLLSAADPTSALLLSLEPADTATTRSDAEGVAELIKEAMQDASFISALPDSKRDSKKAQKCEGDKECLLKIVKRRGADLVGIGEVSSTPTGYAVSIKILNVDQNRFVRTVEDTFDGEENDAERLMRKCFAPDKLFAHLDISGRPEGADVQVNGRRVGEIPLDKPIRVLAGEHKIRFAKKGFVTQNKPVSVEFREVLEVEILLSAERGRGENNDEGEPTSALAMSLGASSIVALAGGVGVGAWSLLTAQEVEKRAAAQQLVFPRDNDLIDRGVTTAWISSILSASGIVLAGAAATVFFMNSQQSEEGL